MSEGFTTRSQIVDKLVNISATYWGNKIDTTTRDETKMLWKTDIYDKALNLLSPDKMGVMYTTGSNFRHIHI